MNWQKNIPRRSCSLKHPAHPGPPHIIAARHWLALPEQAKAAFTLRLDAERHLQLRLVCAVRHRSAQQIVTEALDAFLSKRTHTGQLWHALPGQLNEFFTRN